MAVAPPRADAEVFAQPEHLSLSSIQPVHTADKHHAVQCTSVSKKRSLSTVLLLHLFHCFARRQSKFTEQRRAQLLLSSCCSLAGGAQQLPCEQALLTPYFYDISRISFLGYIFRENFLVYLFWDIFSGIFRGNFKFYSQDVSWICKDSCGHLFIIL